MDANQDVLRNPFDMDEDCPRCDALRETRSRVVHGYGDVGADFLFVGEMPDAAADETGVPFAASGGEVFGSDGEASGSGDEASGSGGAAGDGAGLFGLLEELGFALAPEEAPEEAPDPPPGAPVLDGAYLTYLARCRHPDRGPTDAEVANCEPFLNADVRMINPEILVPVGQRALVELGREYTTTPAEDLDVAECHATTVRGRGFELLPMLPPAEQTDAQRTALLECFEDVLGSDYRQTKGRRGR